MRPSQSPIVAAALVAVNGQAPAETLGAAGIDQRRASFDAWSILKYCDNGSNELEFTLTRQDGQSVRARHVLPVAFKMKKSQ